MPPPVVMPPMPTDPVSPKPTARPCSAAAVVTSTAVRPVSAHAVRVSGSTCDVLHVAQVDHDAAVGRAVSRAGVTAAAHRDLGAGRPRVADHVRHVPCVADAHDRGRTQVVIAAGQHGAGLLVVGVLGRDHPPRHGGAQVVEGGRCGRCGRHRAAPPCWCALLPFRRRSGAELIGQPWRQGCAPTSTDSSTGSAAESASSHRSTEPPTMIASRPSSVSKKAIHRRRSGSMPSGPGGTSITSACADPAFSTVTCCR